MDYDNYADSYGNFKFRKHDSKGRIVPDPDLDAEGAPPRSWEIEQPRGRHVKYEGTFHQRINPDFHSLDNSST